MPGHRAAQRPGDEPDGEGRQGAQLTRDRVGCREEQRSEDQPGTGRIAGVPVTTLYDWRTRNYGPKGKRVGK